MKSLSISTAWSETAAFVRREAGLLFPVALGLIALPTAFLQAFVPGMAGAAAQPAPGLWMLLLLPVVAISAIGQLTIIALALGREVVVRDALALALRRCLPAIGAAFLFGFGAVVFLLPFIIIAAFMGNQTKAMLILAPFIFLLFLFLSVRLMLLSPVAAAEQGGPVTILKRSWDLTRGQGWKLFGLVLIVVLVYLVIVFAISSIGGILILTLVGTPEPGSLAFFLSLFLSTLLNTAFGAIFATLVARIYAQLVEPQNSGA